MQKLKFAIVGCGQIAQRHARHIAAIGELVAVCDTSKEKAQALADQYAAMAFTDLDSLLESLARPDVIVICTPNGLHAQQTIRSLTKGYHVLVEKPMALTTADCSAMIAASRESGKRLFTVMQNRFNPPVQAIKRALDQHAFGKISAVQLICLWHRGREYYSNSWRGTREMDGGILFTQFSHFIDLLTWFFGEVRTLQAVTANSQHQGLIEFEDQGSAILQFETGILCTIHFSINSYGHNREGSLAITGDKGMAKIGGEYLNTIEYQQFENYKLEHVNESGPANDYGHYQGSMSNHAEVYRNLVASLQSGAPYYASAEQGLQTISLIERIYAAADRSNA
jgi:UDP-N-acetyl-2-amino-2-deoxyglucuronate dehydrogenase